MKALGVAQQLAKHTPCRCANCRLAFSDLVELESEVADDDTTAGAYFVASEAQVENIADTVVFGPTKTTDDRVRIIHDVLVLAAEWGIQLHQGPAPETASGPTNDPFCRRCAGTGEDPEYVPAPETSKDSGPNLMQGSPEHKEPDVDAGTDDVKDMAFRALNKVAEGFGITLTEVIATVTPIPSAPSTGAGAHGENIRRAMEVASDTFVAGWLSTQAHRVIQTLAAEVERLSSPDSASPDPQDVWALFRWLNEQSVLAFRADFPHAAFTRLRDWANKLTLDAASVGNTAGSQNDA